MDYRLMKFIPEQNNSKHHCIGNLNLSKISLILFISYFCAFIFSAVTAFHARDNQFLISTAIFFCFGIAVAINAYVFRKIFYIHSNTELINQMFSAVIKSNSVFFLIYDEQGNIAYCDERMYQYFAGKNLGAQTELQKIISAFHMSGEDAQKVTDIIYRDKFRNKSAMPGENNTNPPCTAFLNYGYDQYVLNAIPLSEPSGFSAVIINSAADNFGSTLQLEQAHIGYYRLDELGIIIETNGYLAKILGYNMREFLEAQVPFQEIIDLEESMDSLIKDTKRIDTLKGNWQGFLTLRTKFKEIIHTFILQRAEFKSNGEISRIRGYVIKLQDPSLMLKSKGVEKGWIDYSWKCFFENSPYPVSILDKAGKILRINRSFEEMLPRSFLGHRFEEIFTKEERGIISAEINAVMHKGKAAKPLKALKIEGNERVVDIYLGKILDLHGETFGFMVRISDITQQKELEESLSHAQRMQTIGHLVGSVAHDFNNLLTAITGFCDLLLLKHTVGDPSFAHLIQIKQSSDRATNLVKRLLAFSRKQTMRLQVVNLSEMFTDFAVLVQRLVGTDIKFHQEVEHGAWSVKIDPVQMEQVILNLAVNAHHAMQSGGELSIKAKNVILTGQEEFLSTYARPVGEAIPPAGEYVEIEVTDSGSGIPNDIIQKIFEPFFTTRSEKLGTGLGLSTVYGIIRQSEGYILVKSQVGVGTTFLIYLHRHLVTPEDELEIQKLEDDKNKDTESKQDLTGRGVIALVEDEESVRLFAKSVLVSKGYEVLEFESAKKALETIAPDLHRIDLIITDVMMPEMTGPALITEVQKISPEIKVIFISGYGEDAFTEEYGKRRDFHFIPKPFSLKALVAKVKEVLT